MRWMQRIGFQSMKSIKWLATIPPYLAIGAGIYAFKNAWITLIGYHLTLLLILSLARPAIRFKILLQTRSLAWIRRSLFASAGIGITIFFLHPYLGFVDDYSSRLEALGLNPSTWPAFLTYITLTNPFLEEFFWRAHLGSEAPTLHFTDVLYAGYHGLVLVLFVQPWMVLLSLAVLTLSGWLWRRIYRMEGGLLVPVAGHMAADFFILLAVCLISG